MLEETKQVLGHYYISHKYHKSGLFIKRLASEVAACPSVGSVVFIKPSMMFMNDTKLTCGLYLVTEILPNKVKKEPIYDYINYKDFFHVEQTLRFIVTPVYYVDENDISNLSYSVEEVISDTGSITQNVVVKIKDKIVYEGTH